jgi:hypothetical protein
MPKRENLPDVPNAAKIEQGPSMSAAMAPALGLAALGGDIAQTASGIHRDSLRTQDMKDKGHLSDVRHQMSLAQDEHEAYRKVSTPDTWQHDWNTRVDNVKRHALGDPENPVSLLTPNYERLDRMMEHWQERGHADVAGAAQAAELRHATDMIKGNIRHAVNNGDFNGARDHASLIDDRHARDKSFQFIDQEQFRYDKADDRAAYIENSVGPGYAVAKEELEKDNRFSEADKSVIRRAMLAEKKREDSVLLKDVMSKILSGEYGDEELFGKESVVPEHILPEDRKRFLDAAKVRHKDMPEEDMAKIRNAIYGLQSTYFKLRQENSGEDLDRKYLEAIEEVEREHITPNQANKDFEDNVEGLWNNSSIDKMRALAANLDANPKEFTHPLHVQKQSASLEASLDEHFDDKGAIGKIMKGNWGPDKTKGTGDDVLPIQDVLGLTPNQARHEFEEDLERLITENWDLSRQPNGATELWKIWAAEKKLKMGRSDILSRLYWPPGGRNFAEMLRKAEFTKEDLANWQGAGVDEKNSILIKLRRRAGAAKEGNDAQGRRTADVHLDLEGKKIPNPLGYGIAEKDKEAIMAFVADDLGIPEPEERTKDQIAEEAARLEFKFDQRGMLPGRGTVVPPNLPD